MYSAGESPDLRDLSGLLVLVGAGKMGGALLDGWLRSGLDPEKVAVIEPNPTPQIAALADRGVRLNPDATALTAVSAVVIAVKPQIAAQALPPLATRLAKSGGGAEEWARLIRAYSVLHETDKAKQTLAAARTALASDAKAGAGLDALARDPDRPVERMTKAEGFPLTGREVVLTAPLSEAAVRALKVGDVVLINGEMFTGRDNVHAWLMKNPPPVDLQGAVLYHCGPVMLKQGERWVVKGAGPTTSMREEPYQAEVIQRYGVRAVVGKGGMGAKTLAALQEYGAVYLNAIGGAAQFYARTVQDVPGVYLMEFGVPEAMWRLQVHGFVAIVTMDAHGNSLHAAVEKTTGAELAALATLARR